MGCGIWGRGDSGLWNRGGHLGDTLSEMACLSGHTATGASPPASNSQRSQGRLRALDDADQASSDFGVGDRGQSPGRGIKKDQ